MSFPNDPDVQAIPEDKLTKATIIEQAIKYDGATSLLLWKAQDGTWSLKIDYQPN